MKMFTRLSSALLAVLMVFMLLPIAALTVGAADGEDMLSTFSVMSYNVKVNSAKQAQFDLLNKYSADIIGLQELSALNSYSTYASHLSGYTGYQGSDRGDGQYTPIFYKTSKFTLKESGTFWLSDTPNTRSKFSDSNYYRIATWVLLYVNGTSAPAEYVLAFNAHLDYDTYKYTSTAKQAKVLMQQVAALETSLKSEYMQGDTVLGITIGGDFNVGPTHGVVKFMTGTGNANDGTATPLTNTYTGTRFATARSLTSNFIPNTYVVDGNAPIAASTVFNTDLNKYAFEFDHILATSKSLACSKYEIVSDYHNSDHMPVMASFQLKRGVDSAKLSLLNIAQDDTSFSFYQDGALQAATAMNCAPDPTNPDYTSKFKFTVTAAMAGNLKASVDKLEIFNGPQAQTAFTPYAKAAATTTPTTPSVSGSFTKMTSSNIKAGVTMNAASAVPSGFSAWTTTNSPTFSGGAMTLSAASGSTTNSASNMVESSSTSTARWGSGTSANITVDITAKFPNTISVPSNWTPGTGNYGGQTGYIFDIATQCTRSISSGTYAGITSKANYPAEFYISIVRSERGSTNALITNLYGNRNGLGTYNGVNIEYQAVNIDFDHYHRYTFTYQQTASSNKRVFVYCDGVQLASFTDSMYRNSSSYNTEGVYLAIANRGYTTANGSPATAVYDRIGIYSGKQTPADTSALAAAVATATDKLSGAYEAGSLQTLRNTLGLAKTQFDDGTNASYLSDPLSTSGNNTWVTNLTNAINNSINNLVEDEPPKVDVAPEGVLWFEGFNNMTEMPSTLTHHSGYPTPVGNSYHTVDRGYLDYNVPHGSATNGDILDIQTGGQPIGNSDGVTVSMYASLDELPTLSSTETSGPYRGLQVELYLAGVDKMVTVGLNAMTSAEKSANPGYNAWMCLFTVVRGKNATKLPVNLAMGDGMVHKLTFVFDNNAVRDLTGNVFGIYTDANCTQLVDTINVSGSITSSPDLPLYVQPKNSNSGLRTYYIKQLSAAPGYFMAKDVLTYTMTAADESKTVFLNEQSLNYQPIYSWNGAPTFTVYSGAYDGQSHAAITSVNNPYPSRVSVKYSTDGTSWGNTIPTFSDAGNFKVYAKAIDGQGAYADTVTELDVIISYVLSVKIEGGNGSVTVAKGATNLGTFTAKNTSYVAGVQFGDTITLTADAANFLCWKNARNGRELSTENVLTYPAGTQMDLVAVYADSGVQNAVSVIFKDSITGKIYKVMGITAGTALKQSDLPEVTPALFGYDFSGWFVGSKTAAVGAVINADTTVFARYQRTTPTYRTLSVDDNGTITRYTQPFAKTISVTATGANFSYWKLGTQILTTKATVIFGMPDENVTLTAVYGAPDTPTAPILSIVSGAVNGQNAFATIFARSIPSNVTFVESGILMTRKADPKELYIGTTELSVTKGVSTASASDDCYGFQKDMTGKEGTWYFRNYLIYKDGSGNLSYAYSDVYKLTVAANTAATAAKA